MSRIWNNRQAEAIAARGRNTVVSAGAGSGKTAVLTERVFRLIDEGESIDHLLVLTFTNAAASEMKARIRARLQADHPAQAALVDGARIMTFDAFALSLVKKYHYVLGLERDLDIIDESLLDFLRKQTMDEIMIDRYEARDPSFIALIESYATRDDNKIRTIIESVDRVADLKIDKMDYLRHYIAVAYDETTFDAACADFIALLNRETEELMLACKNFAYEEMGKQAQEYLMTLRQIEDFDAKIGAFTSGGFPGKIRGKLTDEDKDLHENIKKRLGDLGDWCQVVVSKANARLRYGKTKDFVATIVSLAVELEERLLALKKKHHQFSFADIAKFAISIAIDPSINEELKAEIRHIMIDEYQDTNDLQEYFINLLASDNVYVVGDIKQSIYRFRNANCDIFMKKYRDYDQGNGGVKIDMNRNYRSRPTVLAAINDLFSMLMSSDFGGADYKAGHRIDFGLEDYETLGTIRNPTGMAVLGYERQPGVDPLETEISIIARDIIAKVKSGHQVYDKKDHRVRSVRYDDFAILIDRKTSFGDYQKTFNDYGIPLDVQLTDEFHESDVLNVFENLIRLVAGAASSDFPKKHLHEWASVSRSFVYGHADKFIHERVNAFRAGTAIDDDLVNRVKTLATSARTMTLEQLLMRIAFDFDLHHKAIALGDVAWHHHRINQLIRFAMSYQGLEKTLDDLVGYFDESERLGSSLALESPSQGSQSVRLMTIHKSKGLEFPIVYYPGLSKKFNHPEEKTSMFAHGRYGIVVPMYDGDTSYNMFHYLVRADEKKQALAEEMRKLYVALTRAEEAMIILYEINDKRPFTLLRSRSFHDFLAFAGIYERFGSKYEFPSLTTTEDGATPPAVNVAFKQLNIPFNVKVKARPSASTGSFDDASLAFGTALHELLSRIDFSQPDFSFIEDLAIRQAIASLLLLPPFSGSAHATVYQEYPFYDSVSDTLGVIDLMLEFAEEIRIIDYKTGTIDKKEYDEQVRAYARFIKGKTIKKVNAYLVSLTRQNFREVPQNE